MFANSHYLRVSFRLAQNKLESVCKRVLQGVFTGKDIQALAAIATQLIEEGSVRDGFDSQSHFVKSASSRNPHTVKKLASGMFACDKDCLRYKTRNLCSHVITAAFYKNQLQEFLSKFKVVNNKSSRVSRVRNGHQISLL